MLDMMGSLLDRSIVHKIFQHNYPILVKICSKELDTAKVIFDRQLARCNTDQGPILNKNMPLVAGILKWCQEMKDRSRNFMEKLKFLSKE